MDNNPTEMIISVPHASVAFPSYGKHDYQQGANRHVCDEAVLLYIAVSVSTYPSLHFTP